MTRTDLLRRTVDSLIDLQGEGVSLSQTFALASAIGPYLVETFTDREGGRWLRLSFRDDPEGASPYVTAPDGGPDGADDEAPPVLTAEQRAILAFFSGPNIPRGPGDLTGKPAEWLPPEGAKQADLSALVRARLLRRGMPPNADCFTITQAGLEFLQRS